MNSMLALPATLASHAVHQSEKIIVVVVGLLRRILGPFTRDVHLVHDAEQALVACAQRRPEQGYFY